MSNPWSPPGPAAPAPSVRPNLRSQLTAQLYDDMQGMRGLAAASSVVLAALLWEYIPLAVLAAWLAARLGTEAMLALLARAYRADPTHRSEAQPWLRRYAQLHLATAAAWGASAVFMFWPMPELMRLLLATVTFAVAGLMLVPMSAFYRVYSASLVVMLVPVCLALILSPPLFGIASASGVIGLALTLHLRHMGRRMHGNRVKALKAILSYRGLSRQLHSERDRRRQIQQRLIRLTQFDPITGLPNQGQFFSRAQGLLQSPSNGTPVVIVLIDLDGFIQINSSLGRAAGDYLLAQVGSRLSAALPAGALVSRLSADDFAVAAPVAADPAAPARLVEQLRRNLEQTVVWEEREIEVRCTIGYSVPGAPGQDVETLLKQADIALRQARQTPSERKLRFRPEMETHIVNRFSLRHALGRALGNGELSLAYQPLVALTDGRVVGAEALLRWNSPQFGSVAPAEFIPLAEQSGLINEIGAWVLAEACRQASSWQRQLGEFAISVNVSVQQLAEAGFPQRVARALRDSGLPPAALRLEITESVIMTDPDSVLRLLNQIRRSGVRIALDDFGTGYSSLGYLTELEIDCLKLDKSFIRNASRAPESAAVVRAVIQLGRALQLEVVAEGIETLEDWQRLQREGCPYGQGFYFSRPLPATEFERLARRSRQRATGTHGA